MSEQQFEQTWNGLPKWLQKIVWKEEFRNLVNTNPEIRDHQRAEEFKQFIYNHKITERDFNFALSTHRGGRISDFPSRKISE